MNASPYTRIVPDPVTLSVLVVPLHVVLAPSRITERGLVGVGATTPPPINFRNVPVRLNTYWLPPVSAVSVTLTVIDVGVPVHSGVAVGKHVIATLATFDATTLLLNNTPLRHSRRDNLFAART